MTKNNISNSNTVYGFILECQKLRFTTPQEGICAPLNSRTQTKPYNSRLFKAEYLKDVILVLFRENSENKMPVKHQLYSIVFLRSTRHRLLL